MGEKATPRPVLRMNFTKCMRVISRRSVLSGSYASKKGKLYGLAAATVSCCVIAISNRMDVVRQWGHRKKKECLYLIIYTLSPLQRFREGCSVRTPQFVCRYLKKSCECVGIQPTGYIVGWQCFYFCDCLECPIFLPYCSVCC